MKQGFVFFVFIITDYILICPRLSCNGATLRRYTKKVNDYRKRGRTFLGAFSREYRLCGSMWLQVALCDSRFDGKFSLDRHGRSAPGAGDNPLQTRSILTTSLKNKVYGNIIEPDQISIEINQLNITPGCSIAIIR